MIPCKYLKCKDFICEHDRMFPSKPVWLCKNKDVMECIALNKNLYVRIAVYDFKPQYTNSLMLSCPLFKKACILVKINKV